MAVAGAGAGARAEIMDKAGAEAENKSFRLRNTAFLLWGVILTIGSPFLNT